MSTSESTYLKCKDASLLFLLLFLHRITLLLFLCHSLVLSFSFVSNIPSATMCARRESRVTSYIKLFMCAPLQHKTNVYTRMYISCTYVSCRSDRSCLVRLLLRSVLSIHPRSSLRSKMHFTFRMHVISIYVCTYIALPLQKISNTNCL